MSGLNAWGCPALIAWALVYSTCCATAHQTDCHAAPEHRAHRIYLHWLLTRRTCCSRCAGQELHTDWLTVHGSGLRNRATLNAIESPEPNRFTKAPSEYRPTYERINFTWMFSQAVCVVQRRRCPSEGQLVAPLRTEFSQV